VPDRKKKGQSKGRSKAGRGGRPKLDDTERRSRMIGVPVNDDEYEAIGGKAKVHHMTRAFFLRHVGLGYRMRRPIPPINYLAYRNLGRMAANLNRVILLINLGKPVGISGEFAEQLYELLQSVRRNLLGVERDDHEGN
jgi:hypothetical protein